MSISITSLNGTDALSSSRITINDNFSTITDALNSVLAIIDISTGKINNSAYGSDNDIETEDLIVRGSTGGGITVITGSVNVNNGNVISGGYVELGSGSNVRFEKIARNFASVSGTIPVINFSGTAGTGGTGPVGGMILPRLELATVKDIQFPQIGAVVNVVTGASCYPVICTQSGVTGTWKPLTLGTAI